MRSSVSGQASTEYVGVLALITAVLAVAGTAVAAPDLAGAVVHHVKVALCIVGGDVCRDADAKAMGLEPCAKHDERHDDELSVGAVATATGRKRWTLAERSDGTALLTAATGAGVGIQADLVKVHKGSFDAGVGASGGGEWLSGDAWVLSKPEAQRVIAAVDGDVVKLEDDDVAREVGLPAPTYSYTEGGLSATSGASVSIGDEDRAAHEAMSSEIEGDLLLGRRRGTGGTVWYFRGSAALQTALADLGIPDGDVVVEYHTGTPATVVARAAGGRGDELTEHLVTIPVRRPDLRDMVLGVLRSGSVTQPFEDLVSGTAVGERRTYRVSSRKGGGGGSILGIGLDRRTEVVRRTLTGAEVLLGGRKVQRVDCLGGVDVVTPR